MLTLNLLVFLTLCGLSILFLYHGCFKAAKILQVGCQGPKGAYLSVYLEIERESEKDRLREKEKKYASGSTQPKTKSWKEYSISSTILC